MNTAARKATHTITTKVEQNVFGAEVRAVCSCGYESEPHEQYDTLREATAEALEDAAENHPQGVCGMTSPSAFYGEARRDPYALGRTTAREVTVPAERVRDDDTVIERLTSGLIRVDRIYTQAENLRLLLIRAGRIHPWDANEPR